MVSAVDFRVAVDGLGEIIGKPGRHEHFFGSGYRVGRQGYNRRTLAGGSFQFFDSLHGFHAVHPRHHVVEEYHVEMLFSHQF